MREFGSTEIEWSLRAFASMQAVRLFLLARAVINFLMRAASTFKITNGEQRALRKFSASWNLSSLKLNVLRHIVGLTPSKLDNRRRARQRNKTLSLFNHSK